MLIVVSRLWDFAMKLCLPVLEHAFLPRLLLILYLNLLLYFNPPITLDSDQVNDAFVLLFLVGMQTLPRLLAFLFLLVC